MSRIWADYGDVRIVIEGHSLIVQKFVEYNDMGWTGVAAFHEISDDYAFSNARECAVSTLAKMKESA